MSATQQVLVAGGGALSIDPPFAAVSLLLHMDGSNGGTTFTDNSSFAHTMTRTGSTTSTAQSKFGGSSGLISAASGTNGVFTAHSTDLSATNVDFTIELWCYLTAANVSTILYSKSSGTGFYPYQIHLDAGQHFGFRGFNSANTAIYGIAAAATASTGQWYFIQAKRSVDTFSLAVDGVQVGTQSVAGGTVLFENTGHGVAVGNYSSSASNSFIGHIDEVRFTKGYALPFSNRGSPFPDS